MVVVHHLGQYFAMLCARLLNDLDCKWSRLRHFSVQARTHLQCFYCVVILSTNIILKTDDLFSLCFCLTSEQNCRSGHYLLMAPVICFIGLLLEYKCFKEQLGCGPLLCNSSVKHALLLINAMLAYFKTAVDQNGSVFSIGSRPKNCIGTILVIYFFVVTLFFSFYLNK